MKKLLLLTILILMTWGCSSDDKNSNPNDQNLIVGKWIVAPNSTVLFNDPIQITFNPNKNVEYKYFSFGNNGEDVFEYGTWNKKEPDSLIIQFVDADPGLEFYQTEILKLNHCCPVKDLRSLR